MTNVKNTESLSLKVRVDIFDLEWGNGSIGVYEHPREKDHSLLRGRVATQNMQLAPLTQ